MKIKLIFILMALALFAGANWTLAQGTAFMYQGQLQNNGLPVSGTYNMQFTLYANSAGSGSPAAGPVAVNGALVSNGVFTVTMDFGSGPWTGQSNWLQIAVEAGNSNSFTTLAPLQPVTPVPYAIYAESAATAASATTANSVAANSILSADIPIGQVVKSLNNINDAVTLSAGNNITITPSGHTLTISGSGGWALTGNAGTIPGTDFVGTTDYNPLEMHVYGERAFRLEPTGFANEPNVVGGSVLNADSGIDVTISGGYSNNIAGVFDSCIGGGYENNIQGGDSVIPGGYQNMIQSGFATYSVIGGGGNNTNVSTEGTIAGGAFNVIQSSAQAATIAGGLGNFILPNANYATIAGGYENSNAAISAAIAGGSYNTIVTNANYAAIAGGYENSNAAASAAIGGGALNWIQAGALYSAIGGGEDNWILSNSVTTIINTSSFQYFPGAWATLDGGFDNTIGSGGSFIGGGYYNFIDTNSIQSIIFLNGFTYTGGWAVVAGGADNTNSACVSFIGGGGFNWIEPNATWSVIGGGEQNMIDTNSIAFASGNPRNSRGAFSVIDGGVLNLISSGLSSIGGGNFNTISLNSADSVIAGGSMNTISNSATSVISGGVGNTIATNGTLSSIGGGEVNSIFGQYGAISGGEYNTISNLASDAAILGGDGNIVGGDKYGGTVLGGFANQVTGQYSVAAGDEAQCTNDYSFVWSDGSGYNYALGSGTPARSTGSHQFIIGAQGGVGINTAPVPANSVSVGTFGTLPFDMTVLHGIYAPYLYLSGVEGLYAPSGLGIFQNLTVSNVVNAYTVNGTYVNGIINGSSDRNLKDHFAPIKAGDILDKVVALPISQWDFKADEQARHLGPMAQDFHKAFGLNGGDDKHIGVLDESGVALAAIQGLNQKVEDRDQRSEDRIQKSEDRIQTLEGENAKLEAQVAELRAMVMQLAQNKMK